MSSTPATPSDSISVPAATPATPVTPSTPVTPANPSTPASASATTTTSTSTTSASSTNGPQAGGNQEAGLFGDLSAETLPNYCTEVQSLCMNCREQGVTRLLLTRIPFFREVILMGFECPHCGFKNNEVQSGAPFAEKACRFELSVQNAADLDRQIVKSEWATIRIPQLDFEIPPNRKAWINTVEGCIRQVVQELRETIAYQRTLQGADAELLGKLVQFVLQLERLADGKEPFVMLLEDPAGNSFVENPHAPYPDPQLKVLHHRRSHEENAQLGLEPEGPLEPDEADAAAAPEASRAPATSVAGSSPEATSSTAVPDTAGLEKLRIAAEAPSALQLTDSIAPTADSGSGLARSAAAASAAASAAAASAAAASAAAAAAAAPAAAASSSVPAASATPASSTATTDASASAAALSAVDAALSPESRAKTLAQRRGAAGFDKRKQFHFDSFRYKDEMMSFPGNCSSCSAPCQTRMVVIDIPFFKEVVLMSTTCDLCGYRDNEVKGGGAIPPKGRKLTLTVQNSIDLNRDVLKSDTASLMVPEIDLELGMGTMGGKFTTVEGLLTNIRDNLDKNQFLAGDSARPESRSQLDSFLAGLDDLIQGRRLPFTLIIIDPVANSYIQNLCTPEPDPQLLEEEFERNWEQNEELGLNDIQTDLPAEADAEEGSAAATAAAAAEEAVPENPKSVETIKEAEAAEKDR